MGTYIAVHDNSPILIVVANKRLPKNLQLGELVFPGLGHGVEGIVKGKR
jgi:hypothetical protein